MRVCVHTRQHINPSISTCYGRVITPLAIMSSWDINKQENELKEIQFFMLLLKVCYQRSGSGVCEYEDLGVPAFEASVCS